jgi:hypothetical protein
MPRKLCGASAARCSIDPLGGFLSRDAIHVPVEQYQVQVAFDRYGRGIGQMRHNRLHPRQAGLRHRNHLAILLPERESPGRACPRPANEVCYCAATRLALP